MHSSFQLDKLEDKINMDSNDCIFFFKNKTITICLKVLHVY